MKKLSLLTVFVGIVNLSFAQVSVNFPYTGSLQRWIVPPGVTQATVTATGAVGGSENVSTYKGGSGAGIIGIVPVTSGHTILIISGGAGTINGAEGGGGGASYVYDSNTNYVLIVGGGGGGAGGLWNGGNGQSNIGSLTTPTLDAGSGCAAGGTGGNGGKAIIGSYVGNGTGGAGWLTNGSGSTSTCCTFDTGGKCPSNGAGGGCCYTNGGYGGGGCGVHWGGGGGGGYNGGGGGGGSDYYGGGGGGSYCSGTVLSTSASNSGNGSVNITSLSSILAITISSQTDVTCYGGVGSATANTATGGTPPYTYSWSPNGGTNLTAYNLTAGTYTITVTDAVSATATASVTITQPPASYNAIFTSNGTWTVPAGVTSVTVQCWGGGQAGYDGVLSAYCALVQSGAGGVGGDFAQTNNIAVTPLNNYSVNVGSGGVGNGSSGGNSSFTGDIATVTASGGGNSVTNGSIMFSGGGYGYGQMGNDDYGGIGGGGAGSGGNGFSGNAGGYGGVPDGGNGGNGGPPGGYGQPGNAPGGAGGGGGAICMYAFGTGGNGAGGEVKIIWTTPGCNLTTSANAINNVSCNGGDNGNATATPNGGVYPYTYSWSNGTSTISTNNPTGAILSSGTYTVTVTDANSATATATVSITQPLSALGITIASQNNVLCNGGIGEATANAAIGGTSPYTYMWSDGNSQTNLNATGLSAGTYTITATDNNGCTATAGVGITQPALAIAISIASQNNVSCYGGTGDATANTATGGTSPYTYGWAPNGGTNLIAPNLSAGTYTITATDNNGCTATADVNITQPASVLAISLASQNNILCYGGSGDATANVATGGTSPYSYSWSPNGGTNLVASNLSAGTYTITATDANSCTTTASTTITQPATAMTITHDSIDQVGPCNGEAGVIVNGGTAPYTYLWTTGNQTNDTIQSQCAGSYCCSITDNNGCSLTTCVTVKLTTGTNSPDNSSSVNIYPDPNSGYFTITGISQGQVIELYNYLGQKMETQSVSSLQSAIHFDISARPSGIYLVKILGKDGTILTLKKIMKIN